MTFPIGYEAKIEFEKLKTAMGKLAMLAMDANAQTPYAIFLDISGHVCSVTLDVGKDKDEQYNAKLFEDDLDFQYDPELSESEEYNAEEEKLHYMRAVEKAEYMISRLEKFIKDANPGDRPVKIL